MKALQATELTLTISAELDRQRTDKAIAALAAIEQPSLSRARIQALLAAGNLVLNKKPVTDASRKVNVGEIYILTLPPPEKAEPEPQALDLNIVYEDDDVIVIDKPVGLVVHPAPGNRDHTLVNALLAHCGDTLSGIGGVARPGIVHRLDKDTSGLMVVAKNDAAHQALAKQFADRSLSRTYRAVVWGIPVLNAGSIDAPLGRSSKDRKKMAVMTRGKPALTYYKIIENYGVASLIECKLATGRTHQIRVHMAHIGHPLVGDPVYLKRRPVVAKYLSEPGRGQALDFPRQALHAETLGFFHPITGVQLRFTTPPPADFLALERALLACA